MQGLKGCLEVFPWKFRLFNRETKRYSKIQGFTYQNVVTKNNDSGAVFLGFGLLPYLFSTIVNIRITMGGCELQLPRLHDRWKWWLSGGAKKSGNSLEDSP